MTIDLKNIVYGALVLLLLSGVGYIALSSDGERAGGNFGQGGYVDASLSTEVLVGATATTIAATSTSRAYLRIGNASTTGAIWCNASGGAPVISTKKGIHIPASGNYVFSFATDNAYRGTVSCMTAGGNASTTIYEHL